MDAPNSIFNSKVEFLPTTVASEHFGDAMDAKSDGWDRHSAFTFSEKKAKDIDVAAIHDCDCNKQVLIGAGALCFLLVGAYVYLKYVKKLA